MANPWIVEALIFSFCYFSLLIVSVIVQMEMNEDINHMILLV